ncbi:Galactosyl T domain containing protein [Trichuris trichiura]|uniref:Hexosyltransferase n=1 Tax=Trichuris trichiura TaxID=36087 RepID=A0A077ZDD8_TRITR|nr:Galactosyl T domain containing protein [Trichuris trichiura]
MLFRETVGCFTFMLLFSSSTAKTELQNSEPTPSFENYTTAVVPYNNKENCSHEHTFPVTLKYWTKKTSTNCFRYTLLNENFCRERYPETFVIAIVHSHPKNFKRRSLIRKMWANNEFYKKFKLATVFAMGEDSQNPSVQVTLQRELETYEDIIQFSFLDTYKNLTLKAISWLNWASKYCPNASYILKVDDDMFVNIFGIMRLLQKENARNPSVKTFYCTVWTKMKPERNKESKWYVSYDEFSQRVYPKYCSGSSYSLTMRAVRPLLDSVKHTTFLWVDDAYITGLLASVAKVHLTDIRSIYKFSDDKMKNFFDNPSIFVHLPNTMNKRYALWKKTLEFCNMADCSK